MKRRYVVKRGFTLIELLVVVLIIGILAVVAVPQYQKAVEKSQLVEALHTVSSLQRGIDVWLLENGGYPSETINFLANEQNANLDVDGFCSLTEESIPGPRRPGKPQTMLTVYTCISGSYEYAAQCFSDSCRVSASKYGDSFGKSRWFLLVTKRGNDGWSKIYQDNEQSGVSAAVTATLDSFGWGH